MAPAHALYSLQKTADSIRDITKTQITLIIPTAQTPEKHTGTTKSNLRFADSRERQITESDQNLSHGRQY